MKLDGFLQTIRRRHEQSWRRFRIGMIPSLFAAFLQGCVLVTSPPLAEEKVVNTIPASFFSLQGRISVRVGDRLEAGKLHWSKASDEERLQLFTPFGTQVAELIRSTQGVVTLRRGSETITSNSIAELTEAMLGVTLDMDAIAAWTQAIGLKENDEIERRFSNGDAWRVTVGEIRVQGEYRHASRLTAVRGDTVVRLVVDEWRPL